MMICFSRVGQTNDYAQYAITSCITFIGNWSVTVISGLWNLLNLMVRYAGNLPVSREIRKERTRSAESCIGLVVREKTSLIRHARPYCNYGLKVAFIQKSTLYPTDICHSDHEPLWPDNTHSNIRRNIS